MTAEANERVDGRPDEPAGPVEIVVVDRGWVFVGRVQPKRDECDVVVITQARCIRRWGTTRGLGELVNGPLAATVVDEVGTVVVPWRAVIFRILCAPKSNWC